MFKERWVSTIVPKYRRNLTDFKQESNRYCKGAVISLRIADSVIASCKKDNGLIFC